MTRLLTFKLLLFIAVSAFIPVLAQSSSRYRVAVLDFEVTDLSAALKRQNDRDRSGRAVVDVADGWPS